MFSVFAPEIKESIDLVYKYLAITDNPETADAIFVAGGSTITPALKAAELFDQGYSNKLFMTAKRGTFSNPLWTKDDAVVYKDKLIELGIPEDNIFCEPVSGNSLFEADDAIFLMKSVSIDPKKIIIVDRPVHQRREFATFKFLFPEIKFINCPANESVEYSQETLDRIVAEMDRIEQFGLQGTLAPQEVPEDIKKALGKLIPLVQGTFGSK